MVALIWIVRIYRWWMFAWVLMTWIPGLSGSTFHLLLGLPIIPVLAPLNFLAVGGIGFGPIIPLLALYYLEQWLIKAAGLDGEDSDEEFEAEPREVEVWDAEGRTVEAGRRD